MTMSQHVVMQLTDVSVVDPPPGGWPALSDLIAPPSGTEPPPVTTVNDAAALEFLTQLQVNQVTAQDLLLWGLRQEIEWLFSYYIGWDGEECSLFSSQL